MKQILVIIYSEHKSLVECEQKILRESSNKIFIMINEGSVRPNYFLEISEMKKERNRRRKRKKGGGEEFTVNN